jgi:oxalate decarboxylase/phosphoglucose isomerase-like protein (cupin superfamily)
MIDVLNVKPFYIDDRGKMYYLSDEKIKITNVLLITCKKGAVRANHYHKNDSHYVYLLEGKMRYVTQDIHRKNDIESVILKKGDLVYTPSMLIHAMKFLENSKFLALTTETRGQEAYEKDTVRVKII